MQYISVTCTLRWFLKELMAEFTRHWVEAQTNWKNTSRIIKSLKHHWLEVDDYRKKNDKECRHQVDVRVVPDMISLLSTHTCRHAFACSMPDDGRAAMQTTSTESHPIVTDWLNRTEPLWWLAENMPSDLACCWEVAGSSNKAQRARSEVADRSTGGDSY